MDYRIFAPSRPVRSRVLACSFVPPRTFSELEWKIDQVRISEQLFDHHHWSHAVYRMCVRNDVELANVVGMDENAVKMKRHRRVDLG